MNWSVPRSALLPPLLLLGLALFARGYFLSRSELADVSACGVVPGGAPPPPLPPAAAAGSRSVGCWLPASGATDAARGVFSRLVLIIVDGWRYDFAAPAGTSGVAPAPWRGHMPRLASLLAGGGGAGVSARLFRFVADAPTVTAPRLRALATGGLPTFLDAAANFASGAVAEDSVFSQLAAAAAARNGSGRARVLLGIDHASYGHMAVLADDVRAALGEDFS